MGMARRSGVSLSAHSSRSAPKSHSAVITPSLLAVPNSTITPL